MWFEINYEIQFFVNKKKNYEFSEKLITNKKGNCLKLNYKQGWSEFE